MRIFGDWHHGGLGRSLQLLFQDRLGHDIWFPDGSFAEFANTARPGTWLSPNMASAGGIPDKWLNEVGNLPNVCSLEQFLDTEWDAVIISRPETWTVMKGLLEGHPKSKFIRRIGQAGNEGQYYDWEQVPNFLSSDYLSYMRAPKGMNKIHYMQEVGRQFQTDSYIPVTEESLKSVHTYINCLPSFGDWQWDKDRTWWGSKCPHCDSDPATGETVAPRDIWAGCITGLPDHQFRDYGINNSQGSVNEKQMPSTINSSALTWAFKTYEGMGHSIAQSICMGRLCVIPRRFHKYRTANQFLIPNLTCLEAEWTADSCVEQIREFTSSLDRVNEYGEACFRASKGIFNWEHEATRVKVFLDQLR